MAFQQKIIWHQIQQKDKYLKLQINEHSADICSNTSYFQFHVNSHKSSVLNNHSTNCFIIIKL